MMETARSTEHPEAVAVDLEDFRRRLKSLSEMPIEQPEPPLADPNKFLEDWSGDLLGRLKEIELEEPDFANLGDGDFEAYLEKLREEVFLAEDESVKVSVEIGDMMFSLETCEGIGDIPSTRTQGVPAMIEKIHEVKTCELSKSCKPEHNDDQPYKLCAVCHSLEGAVMLMYVTTRRLTEKPHRLSRLILLSPADFHEDSTVAFTLVEHLILLLGPILAPIVPGLYIPTRFFRLLISKLARDLQNYPALGGLVQTLMGYFVGGDSSNWIGVLGLPHYNMYDMSGVSIYVTIHLVQMKRAKKFMMYDYGNAAANMEAYGSVEPLNLGQYYNLIDVPIDLVAGKKDKVIRPSMVRKHYKIIRREGVEVSYNEFEYAHLDFTFSPKEELLAYVMSRLLLVVPPQKHMSSMKLLRSSNKTSPMLSRDRDRDLES